MTISPVTRPEQPGRPAVLTVLRADGLPPLEFPFEVDLRRLSPAAIATCLAAAGEAADSVVPGLAVRLQVQGPDGTRVVVSRSTRTGLFEPEDPAYEVVPPAPWPHLPGTAA